MSSLKSSPDPYLEILLEVNLNFQIRLTIILANGIFVCRVHAANNLVWNSDTLYPGSCHQPRFLLLTRYMRTETDTRHSAIVVVVIVFSIYNSGISGKKLRHSWFKLYFNCYKYTYMKTENT